MFFPPGLQPPALHSSLGGLALHPGGWWTRVVAQLGGPRVVAQGDTQQTSHGSHGLISWCSRSEDERLQFMQGLQDVWRLEGATVLAAFDLSPFPLICDLGGECPPRTLELRLELCL